jgi:transposase-like protein
MNPEGENGERRNVGDEHEWSWPADEAGAAAAGGPGPVRPDRAGVPDPELVEQAKRRSFSAKYKLEIPTKADACTRPGEIGELLRREGLYTSHLTYWRKQVRDGALRELGLRRTDGTTVITNTGRTAMMTVGPEFIAPEREAGREWPLSPPPG